MRYSLLILWMVALVGCGSGSGEIMCTEEARSSVTLKIVDADTGDVLSDAVVVYSVDGGEPTVITCSDDSSFVHDCSLFPLTYEVDGEFEITVSSSGYVDQTKNITIESDECHVIGKTMTFKMSSI